MLVATLGTQPQVVTVTLDLLLARGREIEEVVVIHTSDYKPRMREAVRRLDQEFRNGRYQGRQCLYRRVRLELGGKPIADVDTAQKAGVVFRTVFRQVKRQKQAGRLVHLSIAGGRKSMSVYGMATAQLLFDERDYLWHLLSTCSFEEKSQGGALMHLEHPEGAMLVEIPVLRWSRIPSWATRLMATDDPLEAIRRQEEFIDLEDRRRKREFLTKRLTPAEREIVGLLVQEGLTNKEIGRRLYKSEKTVANQLTEIFGKLHEFLGFRDDIKVNRYVLLAQFGPYFQG